MILIQSIKSLMTIGPIIFRCSAPGESLYDVATEIWRLCRSNCRHHFHTTTFYLLLQFWRIYRIKKCLQKFGGSAALIVGTIFNLLKSQISISCRAAQHL